MTIDLDYAIILAFPGGSYSDLGELCHDSGSCT